MSAEFAGPPYANASDEVDVAPPFTPETLTVPVTLEGLGVL